MLTTATALQHHQQIHARLQLEILECREEIARLKAELRRDQDPARMGHIQKQIGVSSALGGGWLEVERTAGSRDHTTSSCPDVDEAAMDAPDGFCHHSCSSVADSST